MIAVVDYGMGNLRSVLNALALLGADARLASSAADLGGANKLILPGVGAFGDGMQRLGDRGLIEPVVERVRAGTPLLGICLGMQLLFSRSSEHGSHLGLGLIAGAVERISTHPELRVPHVGWNSVTVHRPSLLLDGARSDPEYYFVHSFECRPENKDVVIATAHYGVPITAIVQQDAVVGVQFHPEKSQRDGLALLERYVFAPC
jgi:glutamine amidotransferase